MHFLRKHLQTCSFCILTLNQLNKLRQSCFPVNFAIILRTPYYRTPWVTAHVGHGVRLCFQ